MYNNTTIVNNPMKVITGPDTRWFYANVWKHKSINDDISKYSVGLIISKSDTKTVAKIKTAIKTAYQESQSKLKGSKGIVCGMNNLQFIRDREPLGGKASAKSDFATDADDDFPT